MIYSQYYFLFFSNRSQVPILFLREHIFKKWNIFYREHYPIWTLIGKSWKIIQIFFWNFSFSGQFLENSSIFSKFQLSGHEPKRFMENWNFREIFGWFFQGSPIRVEENNFKRLQRNTGYRKCYRQKTLEFLFYYNYFMKLLK